jgi:cobalamin reductase
MISTADIKEWGIVGAGGAGFPSYVKLARKAKIIIVNAAECEPLLHKDKEIFQHHSEVFFKGLDQCMALTGAQRCIIGIKAKYTDLINKIRGCCTERVEIFALQDFYPAGDEITLIYETTARVVAAGQLPISEEIVVQNVETIYNVGRSQPVVTTFLTVGGDVARPVSLEVPIGVAFKDVIAQARPKSKAFAVIVGGPMMGCLADDLDRPVTKTTGGLLVFPADHPLIRRYETSSVERQVAFIGKAACDQCAMCTELCPRNLLGHPVQPHLAMRKLIYSRGTFTPDAGEAHTLYCCECNLCTLMACPEGLYPSQVCMYNKRELIQAKVPYEGAALNKAHPLISYRRTPIKKVMARLDLNRFVNQGPLVPFDFQPGNLTILLRQHIGAPAIPQVKVGETVTAYQKIATVGENLGAEIHSPMAGRVREVTDDHIVVTVNATQATVKPSQG